MAVAKSRMGNRHSRFAGQYVVPGTLGRAPVQPAAEPEPAEAGQKSGSAAAGDHNGAAMKQPMCGANMIVSNPFAKVFNRPAPPRRSEKRSAPFSVVRLLLIITLKLCFNH